MVTIVYQNTIVTRDIFGYMAIYKDIGYCGNMVFKKINETN